MVDSQQKLAELLLKYNALRFGEFKLKSGATSPYFINFGAIHDAAGLKELGEIFAETLISRVKPDKFDLIVGPAYKGIGLAFALSQALLTRHHVNKLISFNRKEAKGHGQDVGSLWVGGEIAANARVVVIDDVFTSGETKVEIFSRLRAVSPQVDIVALLVGVDREQHASLGGENFQQFCKVQKVRGIAVATISEIVAQLQKNKKLTQKNAEVIRNYIQAGR